MNTPSRAYLDSLIRITDCDDNTVDVLSPNQFASASEHITLVTHSDGVTDHVWHDGDGPCAAETFTGI